MVSNSARGDNSNRTKSKVINRVKSGARNKTKSRAGRWKRIIGLYNYLLQSLTLVLMDCIT